MKRFSVFAAAALVSSAWPLSMAGAQELHVGDCAPVAAGASVVADSDIDCGGGLDGVLSVGAGATVDLSGHTLHGRITLGTGATLANGVVDGSAALTFFPFACVRIGSDAVADSVEIRGCGTGLVPALTSNGARLTNSFLHDNGTAVYVPIESPAEGLVIESSAFVRNGIGAVITAASGALVTSSTFRDNGTGLAIAHPSSVTASGQRVAQNTFQRNDVGVRIFAPAFWSQGGAVIDRNTFNDNGSAGILIEVRGVAGLVVSNNSLTNNGYRPVAKTLSDGTAIVPDDGLLANLTTSELVLRGNKAMRNADYGIDAAGAVDGGGNKAARNVNPAQCSGVAC